MPPRRIMDLFAESLREALRLLLQGNRYILDIVLLSLRVSGLALVFGVLAGLPVGIAVGISRFRGRSILVALIYTGFALPPVVVGLFVYMLLSRAGPLGTLDLLFTPGAMVAAQAMLAAPYVAGISLAAVQAVPSDIRLQALALGATRLQALMAHLREARLGIVAAIVAGFGAVISEVGAVMMVGGNIAGETRVMTTAIVLETRQGDFAAAMAFGLILLAVAFIVNALLTRVQQGRAGAMSRDRRSW
jgi:tungstate transport system permease protein